MSLPVWRIRDDLFIRGMFDKRPRKLEELQELGVSNVISMLRKHDPDLDGLDWLDYRNYPLPDTSTVAEQPLWHAALHAAREITDGKKVLIHCISARDRCPTTAALTLTILEGISGPEAMLRVKQKKPNTFYNKAFVAYLKNIQELPGYTYEGSVYNV